MLTERQREEFETRGVARLPQLADTGAVASFRERLLGFLEEKGVEIDALGDGEVVTPSVFRPIVDALAFEALWGPGVPAVLDQLLGLGGWSEPRRAGQVLFIAPPRLGATWELPHNVWHLDYPAPGQASNLPGVHAFLCLDEIAAGAGATLAIAGSARFVDRIRSEAGKRFRGRSAEVRKRMAERVPWVAELFSRRPGEDRVRRFMERATEVEGIELQVVELTGDAADVILVHPWTLHNLSPNCGSRPRLVITERIHRC